MKSFFKNNGLLLVMLALFAVFIVGQSITGYSVYNEEQNEHNRPAAGYPEYLVSGEFIEAVFENWESEFLQMGSYVLFTVWLRQKGSPESKKLEGEEEVDKDPGEEKDNPAAPWPVRRGGFMLKLYENSFSLVLFALFILSLLLHAWGGARAYCDEQLQHGGQCVSTLGYLGTARFWFESFQNWQSEYLSVGVLVFLSIYLRQRGSPESKPVAHPHSETGH